VITIARDTIEYLVDGRGRRVARKLNGTLTGKWLYEDQLRVVAELDGADGVVSRFVYGERANVPEYLVRGGATYRMILDHLGSVRLVVNAASGAVVQRMDYDAWGNVVEDTNPGFQPFGYAGGLYDAATGLTRFGARDYEARTGRWTARDPRGFRDGNVNVYLYARALPTSIADPSGRVSDEDISNRSEHGTAGLGSYPPIRFHENWGGPGNTNGTVGLSELSNYPYLPSHDGFVRPADALDECFRQHDVTIRKCAMIADPAERQHCRREADIDVAACALTLGDRGGHGHILRRAFTFMLFWGFCPNNNPDVHVK